jgi:hypothetical protein
MDSAVFVVYVSILKYEDFFFRKWIQTEPSTWKSVKVTHRVSDKEQMIVEIRITVSQDAKAVLFLEKNIFGLRGPLGPALRFPKT